MSSAQFEMHEEIGGMDEWIDGWREGWRDGYLDKCVIKVI